MICLDVSSLTVRSREEEEEKEAQIASSPHIHSLERTDRSTDRPTGQDARRQRCALGTLDRRRKLRTRQRVRKAQWEELGFATSDTIELQNMCHDKSSMCKGWWWWFLRTKHRRWMVTYTHLLLVFSFAFSLSLSLSLSLKLNCI